MKPALLPTLVLLVPAFSACSPREQGKAVKSDHAQPSATSRAEPAPTPTLGAVYRIDSEIEPPELLSRVSPDLANGWKGSTAKGLPIFEAIIDETSNVRDVRMLKDPGFVPTWPDFEKRYREAIAKWKYKPAKRNGKPITVYLTVMVGHFTGPPDN